MNREDIIRMAREATPVAWMYTLEYGSTTVDTKVSLHQLRYPFGVCGADYLRVNDDGVSYIRETPLYPDAKALIGYVTALEREECAKLAAWILKMPENDVSSAIRARGD